MKSLIIIILAVFFLRVDLVFCIQCYQCNETDRLQKCEDPKEVTCAGANEICFLTVTDQGKRNVHTCMDREEMFNCSSYDVCKRCDDNLCNAFPIMDKSQARAVTTIQCYKCFDGVTDELTLSSRYRVSGLPSCSSPLKDECKIISDEPTTPKCTTATGKNGKNTMAVTLPRISVNLILMTVNIVQVTIVINQKDMLMLMAKMVTTKEKENEIHLQWPSRITQYLYLVSFLF